MIARIAAVMLALCAVAALGACQTRKDDGIPDGYKLAGAAESGVEDKTGDKDYYLYVPSTWTVDINNTATSAYVSASDPASVSVMTWTASAADSSAEACWDNYREEFESVYSDFKEESREQIKLDGADAISVMFIGSIGSGDGARALRFRQVLAIKGTLVYLLTYSNSAESFDEHASEFSDIVGYFKFR
jgi:hypothetical protein